MPGLSQRPTGFKGSIHYSPNEAFVKSLWCGRRLVGPTDTTCGRIGLSSCNPKNSDFAKIGTWLARR